MLQRAPSSKKSQMMALFCAMVILLASSAPGLALILTTTENANTLTVAEKEQLFQSAVEVVGKTDNNFRGEVEETTVVNEARQLVGPAGIKMADDSHEDEDQEDEESDDDDSDSDNDSDNDSDSEDDNDLEEYVEEEAGEDGARRLAPCTYNLKKLSQWTIPSFKTKYELIRQKRYNIGKGPARFKANNLAFQPACDGTKRPRVLTFLWTPKNGDRRNIGACVGHWGTHWIEIPTISIFDCDGTQLACNSGGGLAYTHSGPKRPLLIVVTPGSERRPDAFKFLFQKRKLNSVWCDWFPFDQ